MTKCQTLRKFWHLELFLKGFTCNLTLGHFLGRTGQKKHPVWPHFHFIIGSHKSHCKDFEARKEVAKQSENLIFLTIFRVFLFSGGSTCVFELLFIFSFCSPQLYLSGGSGGAPAKLKLQLLSLTSHLALLSPMTAFANVVCIDYLVLLLASF